MRTTTRVLVITGLGLGALIALNIPQLRGQVDRSVQRSNTTAPANGQGQRPAAPAALSPAVVGALDMERVIQEYEKYKESSDKFKSEAMKKQTELQAMLQEAKNYAEQRDRYKLGTPDYQKLNDKVAEVQAKYNAEKEKISVQFTLEESSAVADIYNDIRRMTEAVAKQKNMTFVVQVGRNEPITGENPNDVMAALSRNIVYYSPANDITNDVVYALNYYYRKGKEANGTPAPAANPAQSAPANTPSTAAAPGTTKNQ